MDPTLHYVAFGALHKSTAHLDVRRPSAHDRRRDGVDGRRLDPDPVQQRLQGQPRRRDHTAAAPRQGGKCLPSGAVPNLNTGSYGTHLAGGDEGRGALPARDDANNLSVAAEAPGSAEEGHHLRDRRTARRVLVSGAATCPTRPATSAPDRNAYGNGNGKKGCDNFTQVADQRQGPRRRRHHHRLRRARHRAVQEAATTGASRRRARRVRDYLARRRRRPVTGAPSEASPLHNAAERRPRTTDGDYYFCAAQGELEPIFETAIIRQRDQADQAALRVLDAGAERLDHAPPRDAVCTLGGRVLDMTLALSTRE